MSEEKQRGSLVGKYVFMGGDGYYQTGYIEEEIGSSLYLVRLDSTDLSAPTSMVLIPTMMMLGAYDFFNSHDELAEYCSYFESKTAPNRNKEDSPVGQRDDTVVPFKRKDN